MIRKSVNAAEKICTNNALKRASCLKYLVGVPVDPHMPPYFGDPAVGPDQDGGANNPEEGSPIHRLFSPGAVGLEHLVLLVRNQRNRKLVLVAERLLRALRIR